ncbi:MAG: hypothetical protein KAR40_04815 [Candidatus Sabulitectum sp.]|nr:hypothetical protein [Candidatus Sabulitectum sp.]
MTFLAVLIMTILSTPDRTPLLDLYLEATELVGEGRFEESTVLFNEIFTRMPDNRRAVYNHAVSSFAMGDFFTADSLFSIFPEHVFQEDTLLEARSSARLGNAMNNEDHAGVQSVLEMLLPELSAGESSERLRQNYEVALKWLTQNEPPPPEDQEEPEDNEDQEEPEDNENQEESENNEDQEEPGDNEDLEEPEDDEENQPQPPGESEMTPEVAQMILDMVEEAEAETADGGTGGAIGVPNW